MISLTSKAKEKLGEFLKQDTAFKYVRLGVRGGGCSGFEYVIAMTETCEPDWELLEFDNVKLVIDQMSMMYLSDVTLDYVESLLGSGFKFINPQVRSQCGCGQSFSV